MGFWNCFGYGFMHGVATNMLGGGFPFMFGCVHRAPLFYNPVVTCGSLFPYCTPQVNISFPSMNYQSSSHNQPVISDYKFNFDSISFLPKTVMSNPNTSLVNDVSNLKNKKWYEMSDSELKDIYGNYSRNITKPYTGTADDLNKYLEDKGVLKDKGEIFLKAQEEYGINAAVLVAITMHESGKGTSKLAKNKNNVGGVRIAGSNEFKKFDNVEDCIMEMARFLKAGYVENSVRPLTKLYEINARYCPVSDVTDKTGGNRNWAKRVDAYADDVEKAFA